MTEHKAPKYMDRKPTTLPLGPGEKDQNTTPPHTAHSFYSDGDKETDTCADLDN